MTADSKEKSAQVELVPATREQEPILANLLELYAPDFSHSLDIDLGPDGTFGYNDLALYWSQPGRHPFLVKVNNRLAGFVLVKRGSETSGSEAVWDMAEFFVVRRYRRRGIGSRVAHEVWRKFPGEWEVRVMRSNTAAFRFWAKAISVFSGETIHPVRIEKGGECWMVFSFES